MLQFVTSPWMLPVLLTAAIWLAAIALPRRSGGGTVLSVVLRFSTASAATVLVWGAALLMFFFGRAL